MDVYARLIRALSRGDKPKTDFIGKVISLAPVTVDIGVINIEPGYVNADIELEAGCKVFMVSDEDYSAFTVLCKLREV